MAACAASHHPKIQNRPPTTKPKRRKCREINNSSPGASDGAATPPPSSPPAHPQVSPANSDLDSHLDRKCGTGIVSNTSQASCQKTDHSPGRLVKPPPIPLMEFSHSPSNGGLYDAVHSYPSSFTKFNSALTAGLLNPMSPPPATPPRTPPIARSSPTLFEMMVTEPDSHLRRASTKAHERAAVPSAKERQFLMQQRISEVLGKRSPGNAFNNSDSSDIRLTLTDKDGFSVNLSVHRQILVANSVFFAGRLTAHQRPSGVPFEVEISDCEDVEVYVETLRLMYCKDLRRMLIRENVPKILGILKISVAIGFDAGVFSCLEYLEAAPWAEEEEEQITSLLSELRIEGVQANEVLKRLSVDKSSTGEIGSNSEEVLKDLLQVVLQGKDEKARREMKGLFSKMLRESANHNDISMESLYQACNGCLNQLRRCFLQAADSDLKDVNQIARQADNLQWLLDILIDRQMAGEFVNTWGSETEMSNAHRRIGGVHRFGVSRVTARLIVGIGKGEVLAPREARCLLMRTWLGAFYDDFGWMRRVSKGLDRHVIEDGLSNAVLTLPFAMQQEILLGWFDRFLKCGEDCPNIQSGFEVWWRRAFWRRNGEGDGSRLRITNGENQ